MFWVTTMFSNAQTLDSLQQMAHDGNYSKARELAMSKEAYSENADLLFLVGQTYQWEGSQNLAKETFEKVLAVAPNYTEAIAALSAIHISEENFPDALNLASQGLSKDENNETLLYCKAFALANMERFSEARTALEKLLALNPEHENGLELKESMGAFKIPGSISVLQSLQWYNDPHERSLFLTTIEAPVGDKKVKIIPRFNFVSLDVANDQTTGSQAGIDICPLTGPDSYLYFNYAYSDSEVFPSHRSAAEWFKGAGTGWELSGGVRYLYWYDHDYFFSASVSKYLGKWYPGLRFFYTLKNKNDINALASVKRYLNVENTYILFYLGYGPNPDRSEHQIEFKTAGKTTRLTGGANSIVKISGPFYGRLAFEYSKEEFTIDQWRDAFILQTGLEYIF